MSKVAFTTLLNREDSALSPHFGMAKWILIRDDDDGQITFEQNTALNGRAVVDIMVRHGCTDAVFTHIGPGAFQHLEEAGIRGWIGPADMPLPQLLDHLSCGELARAQAPEPMPMATAGGLENRGGSRGPGFRGKERGRGCGHGQQRHGHRGGRA
jgi:predicted Fe-Mo cluster-binding NifX family protein